MSGARVDVVLAKLCAVVIVVLSLQSLTNHLSYLLNTEGAFFFAALAFLFNFGIPVALAAVLWFFPATTLNLKSTDPAMSALPNDPDNYILVGVSLVGLYVLVFGVVDLFYFESVRYAEAQYFADGAYGTYEPSAGTVAGRYTNIFADCYWRRTSRGPACAFDVLGQSSRARQGCHLARRCTYTSPIQMFQTGARPNERHPWNR